MTRQRVLEILVAHRNELRARGVRRLSVFGSIARSDAAGSGDVDLLMEFGPNRPIGLFAFVRLQRYLSELLGQPVDLATPEELREEFREHVLREAVYAG